MSKQRIPTPAESKFSVEPEILQATRTRLIGAIRNSHGKSFTYDADLFPEGTAEILLQEVTAAGWKYEFTSDQRDGDFYTFSPR